MEARLTQAILVLDSWPILEWIKGREPASDTLVDAAVELKSEYPLSFADAFAAALAVQLQAPLVTGDPEFRRLESNGLLTLRWLGA